MVRIRTGGGYARLLESLLGGKLSSPEDTYQSLKKLFLDLHSEARNQQEKLHQVAGSIGKGLVECLGSSNYRAVMRSAKAIRIYANMFRDIPAGCISTLIRVLDNGVMSSAREAALTLACLACTVPAIYLQPCNISVGADAAGILQCLGCEGGYLRGENAGIIVPALVRNLGKPRSRYGNLRVRQACMVALGEIGYTKPEYISEALDLLNLCLNESEMRSVSIFAVGCIGYTRPDLVEGLVPDLKVISARGSAADGLAAIYALRRIGKERKRSPHAEKLTETEMLKEVNGVG